MSQEWLDKADEDEQVVRLILANGGPWAIAAYHIQQASEKYIKALLIESGVAPPKTHELTALLSLCPEDSLTEQLLESAANLSSFAWMTRYPDFPPITELTVGKAGHDLELIKLWVLSHL